jgi:hypothetical protein
VLITPPVCVEQFINANSRVFATDEADMRQTVSRFACTSLDGPDCDPLNGVHSIGNENVIKLLGALAALLGARMPSSV